jgi:hypothetical protein
MRCDPKSPAIREPRVRSDSDGYRSSLQGMLLGFVRPLPFGFARAAAALGFVRHGREARVRSARPVAWVRSQAGFRRLCPARRVSDAARLGFVRMRWNANLLTLNMIESKKVHDNTPPPIMAALLSWNVTRRAVPGHHESVSIADHRNFLNA